MMILKEITNGVWIPQQWSVFTTLAAQVSRNEVIETVQKEFCSESGTSHQAVNDIILLTMEENYHA